MDLCVPKSSTKLKCHDVFVTSCVLCGHSHIRTKIFVPCYALTSVLCSSSLLSSVFDDGIITILNTVWMHESSTSYRPLLCRMVQNWSWCNLHRPHSQQSYTSTRLRSNGSVYQAPSNRWSSQYLSAMEHLPMSHLCIYLTLHFRIRILVRQLHK